MPPGATIAQPSAIRPRTVAGMQQSWLIVSWAAGTLTDPSGGHDPCESIAGDSLFRCARFGLESRHCGSLADGGRFSGYAGYRNGTIAAFAGFAAGTSLEGRSGKQ